MLLREFRQAPRLVNRVRQRLLAIGVQAELERHGRGRRVAMVGGAHHNGVQILALEHAPEIVVNFCVRKSLFGCRQIVVVDVAERDDVLVRDAVEVIATAIRYADNTDVKIIFR